MRILIHSHAFWPLLGGIESVSHLLAAGFAAREHEVTVVTEVPSESERGDVNYAVVRNPNEVLRHRLVRSHDIVYSNGASLRYAGPAWLHRKPFVWTHAGYQLQCLDGAGWVQGAAAPLEPLASIMFHLRRQPAPKVAKSAAALWVRRRVAFNLAAANVAITGHVARRQPLPRQTVISNPADIERFRAARTEVVRPDAPITYLGRLVSEKGIEDLIHAYADLVRMAHPSSAPIPKLQLIGDGPERPRLERLAAERGIAEWMIWRGSLVGSKLVDAVREAGVCVIPSALEEPQGIVVLELMSAGKPLIVSERGGLAESAGDAALTFPNCDRVRLREAIERLSQDLPLQRELSRRAIARADEFQARDSIGQYLELFERILRERATQ